MCTGYTTVLLTTNTDSQACKQMTVFHEQSTHVTGSGITNLYASQCRVFTGGTILREEENAEQKKGEVSMVLK